MRVLRLIFRGVAFVVAIPLLFVLVGIGFFTKPRQRDEEDHADETPVVQEEELEDSALESADDDWIREWLADLSPTRRGRRIRGAYQAQMFRPSLPWIRKRTR